MRRVGAWAGLLAVAVLLAGCTSPPPEPLDRGGPVDLGGNAAPGAPAVDPATGEPLAATESVGAAWTRERWGAAEELPLFQGTVSLGCLLPTSPMLFTCNSPTIYFEPGTVVPPGTAAVVATVAAALPATYPGAQLELGWESAQRDGFEYLPIPAEGVVEIPLAPEDADAPLQQVSWWRFVVYVTGDPVGEGPIDVELTLVARRGAELPAIAPPPDPWAAADPIPLVPAQAYAYTGRFDRTGGASGCLSCDGFTWLPAEAALVPPDATALLATLSWENALPSAPVLFYDRLGVFEAAEAPLEEDGQGVRTYRIPALPEEADSPYQNRSMWRFFVTLDTGGAGFGAMVGSITLEVLVARAATPAAATPAEAPGAAPARA